MVLLLAALTLLSFLQGTILPIDLVVVVLICRSFLSFDRTNLWLAFSFGLLLALLQSYTLGNISLIYLLIVTMVYLFKKTDFATWEVSLLPVSLILLLFNKFALSLFTRSTINLKLVAVEMIFILPVYLAVKIWEERFIPRKDIRLKVGK